MKRKYFFTNVYGLKKIFYFCRVVQSCIGYRKQKKELNGRFSKVLFFIIVPTKLYNIVSSIVLILRQPLVLRFPTA